MKMYLLRTENYEGVDIHGIYSSKERAIESFPFRPETLDESNIEEIEVDPLPPGNEEYENFHYAVAATDGDSWFGERQSRLLPSKASALHLSWDAHRNRGVALAYAPTKEEAKIKAADDLRLIHPVWQVARFQDGSSGFCEIKHAHPSGVYKWTDLPGHKGYAVHEDLETARAMLIEHETTGQILPGFVAP